MGNYVGITIEGRFAIGNEIICCISFNRDVLADGLGNQDYIVASFDEPILYDLFMHRILLNHK